MTVSKDKRTYIQDLILILTILITVLLWYFFFPKHYFVVSVLIIIEVLFYSMSYLDRLRLSAKELATIAALATLAVLGRVLFMAIPQVKPVAALVIVTGLCLGKGPGFMVGLLAMFLSNFFFSQSINTPFQMLGMGTVGFIAGFGQKAFKHKTLKYWQIYLGSFLAVLILYGFWVDTGSVLFMYQYQKKVAVLTIYLMGLPFNLVHAASTVAFLIPLLPLLSKQILRIRNKYGLFMASMIE